MNTNINWNYPLITEKQVARALRFAKPILDKKFSPEKSRQILAAMKAIYPNLEPGTPKLDNNLKWMILRIAVDALAFFRVLPSDLSHDEKLVFVQEFVNNWMDGQFDRWITRKVWATPFLHRLSRILWLRSLNRADETDGQRFDYVKPHGNLFYGANVTRCGIVKYLNLAGAPELAREIYPGDDHIRRYLPINVEFKRTQVNAESAQYCDFRYYFTDR